MRFSRTQSSFYQRIVLAILLCALSLTLGGCSDDTGKPDPSADFLNVQTLAPSVTTSRNGAPYGQTVTFTAHVPNTTDNTGTVTFYDGTTVLQANVALVQGQATYTTSSLEVGDHPITVAYSGNVVLSNTVSAPLTETILQAFTIASLGSAVNPTVSGQGTTFTVTIAPPNGNLGTLTGNVTFTVDGTARTPVALSANQASFSISSLSVGDHTITAAYAGDGHYSPANATFTQTVNQNSGGPTVGSSGPTVVGQAVTFTALVSAAPPGTGTPTGTVTFKDGNTVLGTKTLANGQATFTTSALTVGSHTIFIQYGGDANFVAGPSPSITQVVSKAATSTAITSSMNPAVFGTDVTYSATVTALAPGTGVPTGNVTVSVDGTVYANVTLVGGTASTTNNTLPPGTHQFTVTYNGDANYAASTGTFSQTITQADGTVVLGTSLTPSTYGQAITFTATVGATTGTPTGTMTFKDGGVAIGAPATLVNGVATLDPGVLGAGSHLITAEYSGDGNFNAATSQVLTQDVQPQTLTNLLTSPAGSTVTTNVFIPFTTSLTSGASTSVSNIVVHVLVDSNDAGAFVTDTNGNLDFSVQFTTAGPHTVSTLVEDANYTTSPSNVLSVTAANAP